MTPDETMNAVPNAPAAPAAPVADHTHRGYAGALMDEDARERKFSAKKPGLYLLKIRDDENTKDGQTSEAFVAPPVKQTNLSLEIVEGPSPNGRIFDSVLFPGDYASERGTKGHPQFTHGPTRVVYKDGERVVVGKDPASGKDIYATEPNVDDKTGASLEGKPNGRWQREYGKFSDLLVAALGDPTIKVPKGADAKATAKAKKAAQADVVGKAIEQAGGVLAQALKGRMVVARVTLDDGVIRDRKGNALRIASQKLHDEPRERVLYYYAATDEQIAKVRDPKNLAGPPEAEESAADVDMGGL